MSSVPAPFQPGGPAPTPYDPTYATPPGYPPPPDEEGIDLRMVWAILRRHWYIIVACVALAGVAGWFVTDRMTPVYEANASLRINEQEAAVPGLEVLKDLRGQGSEVNTEMQVLRSRSLAQLVADRLQLRLGVEEPRRAARSGLVAFAALDPRLDTGRIIITTAAGRFSATSPDGARASGAPGDTLRLGGTLLVLTRAAASHPRIVLTISAANAATSGYMDAMHVDRPSRDANIITLRYRHSDPALAEQGPNELLALFLEKRVNVRRTGARSTVSFLRAQLDTLGGELRIAEDSLKNFREANQVVSLQEQAAVSVGKLAELKAERDAVNAELTAIDALLRQSSTTADSVGTGRYRKLLAFPTLLRNQTVSTLLASLTTLETERGRLLTRRRMTDPDVAALTGQIESIETQVASLVGTYSEGLRQQVSAYDKTLGQSASQLNTIPAKEVQLARLMRSTSVLTELSTLLQTRLKEAEIAQAVEEPSAQVVDSAARPEYPVSPRRGLNLALSLMLGMVLALGVVFGKELLDTKVHARDDLQRAAPVPVLGVIPHFQMERPRVGGRLRRSTVGAPDGGEVASTALVAASHPASTVLEAYRALRTNLAFALAEHPPKIVVITSPTPGDGKSTTTANLAAALAQQKLKVLVIDADMRRGALHRTLGGVRAPGLSEILTGRADAASVIQQLSFGGIGRIDMISTGTVPPNPAELLSSPRLHDLLEAAEPLYDTILVDSPPVNNVADALVLAPHSDGVLLVARGNKTERGALRFAMEQLTAVRAKVMGTILNDFDVRRAEAYGGYYRYYYGSGYEATPES